MYSQSFFVTSVRGIGRLPTTAASCSLGCMAFMNAAFGFRPPDFAAAPPFLAADAPPFFAAVPRFAAPLFADAVFLDAAFLAVAICTLLMSESERVLLRASGPSTRHKLYGPPLGAIAGAGGGAPVDARASRRAMPPGRRRAAPASGASAGERTQELHHRHVVGVGGGVVVGDVGVALRRLEQERYAAA